MIRARSILFFLLLLQKFCYAQDSIQARIILVGDAGALHNDTTHPVLNAVRATTKIDKKTTVLYLGDNLYLTGLPDEQHVTYNISRAVLDTQMAIANKTEAKVYFIPGNHDWNRGHSGGWDAVMREQAYIDGKGVKNVNFFPKDGCAGPVEVQVSKDVVMVLFDSQWWIHGYDKPGIESDCPYKTKAEVLNQLEDIILRNSHKFVVLACHHPFRSYGIHGGYFTLKQHIFPLTEMWPKLYFPMPVIGSIYPIARGVFGTPQDMKHPAYSNMIKDVQHVAKQHPNLVFVAGHEHNLQFIKDSTHNYIVSGSGTKKTRVSKNKNAPFTSAENGFAVLNISNNKNVNLSFFTVTPDSVSNPFNNHLLNFATVDNAESDSAKVESVAVPAFKDSVTVVANARYDTASKFKRFILGNNYRKEWATPVQLKVFNIRKEKGGLRIVSLGGGKQTKALKLVDKNGREWTLRTINKDPEGAIPENLRGSLAQDIVQDMISAAHPYAPVTIPPLAKAVGVTVPSPEFFFVPNDPALGIYKNLFSNTVCLLEEREPGFLPDETKSTEKVLNKLVEDNDHHVGQESVLNARLLDMLIGDWDRHIGQWRFGIGDTGKGKLYYAIPRDRDQAYFNSDGLLIKRVSINLLPYLRGFKNDLKKVNWLNWEARNFDRRFLNTLDEEDWNKVIANFKTKLTDEVINTAVRKLPASIFAIRGNELIEKLKTRRNLLTASEAINYYKFLSKEVEVVGSNESELFKISKAVDGLQLKVFKRTKKIDSSSVMFDRVFREHETKELRLYGLNSDDVFNIDSNVNSQIKLRIIGGRGNDTFNVAGKIENYVYDFNQEKNFLQHIKNSRLKLSDDPTVNAYDFESYNYKIYRFPRLNIGFNAEDKLMLGIGFLRRTYGFRNEPYATEQKLSTLYAINRGSYQVNYHGTFNHIFGNTDLVINSSFVHPVLNNFFGLGNLTTASNNREFNRVRYNYVDGEVLFRKRMGSVIQLMAGPNFYHYWNREDDNRNKILGNPSLIGLDSASIYSTKTYAGGKAAIVINNVNNELLPTRGIYWVTQFSSMRGLNERSKPITALTSDLTLYSSLRDPAKVVAVIRAGGGKIYSKTFEYFQALNLGQNNYLRGFRKNRFSGSSLAYGSFELRVKLFESKSYILPGSIGLIGFEEVGKVWMRNEQSKKWHNSYGGGLYFSPYNLVIVSATMAFSEEERLFNFSIGTRFNITF